MATLSPEEWDGIWTKYNDWLADCSGLGILTGSVQPKIRELVDAALAEQRDALAEMERFQIGSDVPLFARKAQVVRVCCTDGCWEIKLQDYSSARYTTQKLLNDEGLRATIERALDDWKRQQEATL